MAVLAVGALAARPAEAQLKVYSDEEGNEISFSAQFQVQARTSSCSGYPFEEGGSACENDVPITELFVRRARVVIQGTIRDLIDFNFQPDFSRVNSVTLLDAYARVNFSAAARLWVGRYKRPFDGFQMTSSTQILTIERDIDIPGIPALTAVSLDELTTDNRFADRDLGLMVDGSTGNLHYWAASFNGQDSEENRGDTNGRQFIGRAQYAFEVGSMPLALAVAGAVRDVGGVGSDERIRTDYVGSFELWGELGDFGGGPHIQAGFVYGKNSSQNRTGEEPDREAGEAFANAYGWQVIGAWKLPFAGKLLEAIEPVLRVTAADPNTSVADDSGWAITPGVQFFLFGRNKLALNWDFVIPSSDALRSENSFKAQYQFYF